MHRLLLIVSLLPLLAAVVLRKLNGDRVLFSFKDTRLSATAGETARKMLDSIGRESVEIKVSARRWTASADVGAGWLALPRETAGGVSARAHGRAALQVGLYLLALRDPKAVARRRWAIRFGHVFPVFTAMVVVFALVVARLAGLWGFGILMASCGLAACAQLLALTAERRAADLACVVLEKKRIFPRLSDEEAVTAVTRAWAWRSVLPGILARLAP